MPIDPRLIYAASNGLDETDGTVAGTTVVKAAVSGFAPVGPMAVLDNTDVAFAAGNGGAIFTAAGAHLQLWTTDGTTGGTRLVETFADNTRAGSGDVAGLYDFMSFGDKVLFEYSDGSNAPFQLWATDGTTAGTYEIPGSGSLDQSPADGAVLDAAVMPCFLAGTLLAGPSGQAAVETLAAGDLVVTVLAGPSWAAPIKWIGRRHVDCRRHADPRAVWPVRITADAFADTVPSRDLFLSPDHAVFVDGMLIPVKQLINGVSIAQIPVDVATYVHIELDRHDIVLAEGLPVETYLDTGSGHLARDRVKSIGGRDWATVNVQHMTLIPPFDPCPSWVALATHHGPHRAWR